MLEDIDHKYGIIVDNILEYKGYYTKIYYSSKDNILYGKIEGISDLVIFECDNCDGMKEEFKKAVDDYLSFINK